LWSYRANPPEIKNGASMEVLPFDIFLAQLGLDGEKEPLPTVSDKEIEELFAKGKIELYPPGWGGDTK